MNSRGKPPMKLSKRGGLAGSQFLEGELLEKSRVTSFREVAVFCIYSKYLIIKNYFFSVIMSYLRT